jgi:hypothetical protein
MQSILSLLPEVKTQSVRRFITDRQAAYPADWFYRPVGIEVEITNKCNLRCAGCGQRDEQPRPDDILTTPDYIRVLLQLADTPIFACSVTGGETLLFLERVKQIISAVNGILDIYKVNTNSYRFVSDAATLKVLQELQAAGFGRKNRFIKAVMVTSIGQQNENGMPLANAVYLTKIFYQVFSPASTICTVNSTDKNLQRSNHWLREYLKLYQDMTGSEVDQRLVPLRAFMLNNVPTLQRLGLMIDYSVTIPELISSFKRQYKSWQCLNILPVDPAEAVMTLTPRCLLQSNGDVLACPGYNYTHKIGNVRDHSLWEIITAANHNPVLQAVFTGGLSQLLKYGQTFLPNLAQEKLSLSYGPCDVCQYITNQLPGNYDLPTTG